MDELNTWFEAPSPHAAVRDALRTLIGAAGLQEAWKWRQPCYTVDGKNIAILAIRADGCTLSFLKGVLLEDPEGRLEVPGENSRSARYVRVPDLATLDALRPQLATWIARAVEIERAGARVGPAPLPEAWVDALAEALATDSTFADAFHALTPGRQRAYDLLIRGAKQAATRASRVAGYRERILAGKGPNDCTCGLTRRPPGCDGSHKHAPTP
jgi:uncharacterized protein YdeI (YjbR/CyaY-like superfamily)